MQGPEGIVKENLSTHKGYRRQHSSPSWTDVLGVLEREFLN